MSRKVRKVRRVRAPSIYDLIDWCCPSYQERLPGSTDYGATILNIFGLTDGRYVWQTAHIRKLFADGRPADWFLGMQPAAGPDAQVCRSFAEALAAAAQQAMIPFI